LLTWGPSDCLSRFPRAIFPDSTDLEITGKKRKKKRKRERISHERIESIGNQKSVLPGTEKQNTKDRKDRCFTKKGEASPNNQVVTESVRKLGDVKDKIAFQQIIVGGIQIPGEYKRVPGRSSRHLWAKQLEKGKRKRRVGKRINDRRQR